MKWLINLIKNLSQLEFLNTQMLIKILFLETDTKTLNTLNQKEKKDPNIIDLLKNKILKVKALKKKLHLLVHLKKKNQKENLMTF